MGFNWTFKGLSWSVTKAKIFMVGFSCIYISSVMNIWPKQERGRWRNRRKGETYILYLHRALNLLEPEIFFFNFSTHCI